MIRIFTSIETEVDNNTHQLLIKWNIILKQIIQTNQGLNDFIANHLVLGVYRIVFDKNLTPNLRKKYADVLVTLHVFDKPLLNFINRLIKATGYPRQFDDMEASDFVQIFDKEIIHPRIALSSKICEYYSERYERELKKLKVEIENKTDLKSYQ